METETDLSTKGNDNKTGEDVRIWPSKRIPQGGLFHTPKFQYSKDTMDLLNVLMQESRVSMLMRKKINECLHNGEPLPKPLTKPQLKLNRDLDKQTEEILKRARQAKRKSLQEIRDSGAYEMPNNKPKPTDRVPSDKAKKILQETMAGITLCDPTLKPKRRPQTRNTSECTIDDIINELLDQINERAEWLAEMEELGAGDKYRDEIREQIAEKLRRIEALKIKERVQKEGIRYVD